MWLDGPEFLLQSEDNWPMDLPWMAVTEEMRSSRSYSAAVKKDTGHWKEIQIGPGDIPALSKLDEKYQELVKACQSEVYEKELHRLKKSKPLHSTSSLLALAPVLGPKACYGLEDGLDAQNYHTTSYIHLCFPGVIHSPRKSSSPFMNILSMLVRTSYCLIFASIFG